MVDEPKSEKGALRLTVDEIYKFSIDNRVFDAGKAEGSERAIKRKIGRSLRELDVPVIDRLQTRRLVGNAHTFLLTSDNFERLHEDLLLYSKNGGYLSDPSLLGEYKSVKRAREKAQDEGRKARRRKRSEGKQLRDDAQVLRDGLDDFELQQWREEPIRKHALKLLSLREELEGFPGIDHALGELGIVLAPPDEVSNELGHCLAQYRRKHPAEQDGSHERERYTKYRLSQKEIEAIHDAICADYESVPANIRDDIESARATARHDGSGGPGISEAEFHRDVLELMLSALFHRHFDLDEGAYRKDLDEQAEDARFGRTVLDYDDLGAAHVHERDERLAEPWRSYVRPRDQKTADVS